MAGVEVRSRSSAVTALPSRRTAADGMRAVGNAPPPTLAIDSTTSAPTPAERRSLASCGCSAPHGRFRCREHSQRRDESHGERWVPVQGQGRFQCGDRQLVDAERSQQRVLAETCDRVGPAEDDAGLRAAQQLVPTHRHDVYAGPHRITGGRLTRQSELSEIEQKPAPKVVDHRNRLRVCQCDELLEGGARDESRNREVAAMDLDDRAGAIASGPRHNRRRRSDSSCRLRRGAHRSSP